MNGEVKGLSYDYRKDFKVLSAVEKRGILKTAQTLLKVQKVDTALIIDAMPRDNAPLPPDAPSRRAAGRGSRNRYD